MLKKIFFLLVLAIVGLGIFIARQPASFRISRSIKIAAPAEVIFPQVNELKKWEGWNPWGKMDPNAQMTYDGPPAGVGASYAWASLNSKVGEGKNTLIESKPNQSVKFKLEFTKPMAATNTTEFTFQREGASTLVTWAMYGENNFMGKAFSLFVDCDKMVGGQFEKGLADMKGLLEHPANR